MSDYASLEEVRQAIEHCTCSLCKTRTKPVMGSGNPNAQVVFVGEAPGFHEDKEGVPFVGAAGKFLDEMLDSIHLARSDIFITNMVHSRPPGNRDPEPQELDASWPYLAAQIQLVKPLVIVTLGRFSKTKFIPDAGPISRVHGQVFVRPNPATGDERQWYVTLYHPAAGLHQADLKAVIKRDFHSITQALAAASATPITRPNT